MADVNTTTNINENVNIFEEFTTNLSINISEKSVKNNIHNVKGYYIDDVDDGLNDLQVLFLACFATLIPLIISVVAAFGIRILWIKYSKRRKRSHDYDGMLERDGTSETINKPLHSHLSKNDKVSTDTNLDISTEEVEVCDNSIVNTQIRSNHSSTNGSIITMTLKNNHLIVETEERNDIEEDSKETTMKYSPSARDGIFIVEVQQGIRRSPTTATTSTTTTSNLHSNISDQCALVHKNAADTSSDTTITSDEINPLQQRKLVIMTGLSQSNTSLSNNSYNYTNQKCYDNEGYGYNLYNGYINDEPLKKININNKLKITSALYKNPSAGSIDIPNDGYLSSDVAAAAVSFSNLENIVDEINKS